MKAFVFLFLCSLQAFAQEGNELYDNNKAPGGQKNMRGPITFLALGDSYTIGERVPPESRWPVQLTGLLQDRLKLNMAEPWIIATTGWTTDELQEAIDRAHIDDETFDLVSLLIGVNNQYRGYPLEQYMQELEELLSQAIVFADGNTERVFMVSIPDYGVTPFGQAKDPEKIASEINLYNSIGKAIAEKHHVQYFDITPISREAKDDPSLIAPDELHPSAKMYSRWVAMIYPEIERVLR